MTDLALIWCEEVSGTINQSVFYMKLVAVIGPSRVTIMLYEEMLMDHGASKE